MRDDRNADEILCIIVNFILSYSLRILAMTFNLAAFVIQFTREKLNYSIRFVMRCQMSASSRMTSSWEMTLVLP